MIAKPQAAEVTLPSDAVVRVVRSFHAPRELVYRAYTTPDLMKRWLLGPPGYLSQPFPADVWPILGFLFLPTTTLAFAFSTNSLEPAGGMSAFGWLLTVVGLAIDLGLLGGGGRAARRRRRDEDED